MKSLRIICLLLLCLFSGTFGALRRNRGCGDFVAFSGNRADRGKRQRHLAAEIAVDRLEQFVIAHGVAAGCGFTGALATARGVGGAGRGFIIQTVWAASKIASTPAPAQRRRCSAKALRGAMVLAMCAL